MTLRLSGEGDGVLCIWAPRHLARPHTSIPLLFKSRLNISLVYPFIKFVGSFSKLSRNAFFCICLCRRILSALIFYTPLHPTPVTPGVGLRLRSPKRSLRPPLMPVCCCAAAGCADEPRPLRRRTKKEENKVNLWKESHCRMT